MSRASLVIPLAVFIALAVVLYAGFKLNDPHELPSALLNKPFPKFSLPALDNPAQQINEGALRGKIHLVNVWGTWCPTCASEHPELMRIAREEGIPILGVDYKDDAALARQWIQTRGNPYAVTVIDERGTLGLDLGVYGAPETFLVDAQGVIRYKLIGDVNRRRWANDLKPHIEALRGAAGS